MHVPPEPIELTGPIGVARTLVFDHRHARQARPELDQRLCMIAGGVAISGELAQQQVVEPGRLLGQRNLGADLERGRPTAPEDAFEANMPDHTFGTHDA